MRVKVIIVLFSVLIVGIYAGSPDVFAHGGAKGIVKERMEVMKSIGKAMKGISKADERMLVNALSQMLSNLQR